MTQLSPPSPRGSSPLTKMNQSQNHSPFQRDPNHPNRHRPCPHLFQRLRAQKKSASNRRKTPTAVVSRCELCGITRSHTDLVHAVVESPSADSLRPRTSTSSKVQTQRERRKTRDESGCLTCRLRKKVNRRALANVLWQIIYNRSPELPDRHCGREQVLRSLPESQY